MSGDASAILWADWNLQPRRSWIREVTLVPFCGLTGTTLRSASLLHMVTLVPFCGLTGTAADFRPDGIW